MKNPAIQRLLRQQAKKQASTIRWNINTLLISYTTLVIVIILTIKEVDIFIVGLLAAFGLAMILLVNWLQAILNGHIFLDS